MYDKEVFHEVKAGLGRISDKTMYRLLANDQEYQELSQAFSEAQTAYYALELPERAKAVIRKYLSANDSLGAASGSLSYLAGVLDSHKILEIFRLAPGQDMDKVHGLSNGNGSVLERLYAGEIFPMEQINPAMPGYKEIQQRLEDEKGYFDSVLSTEDCERLEGIGQMHYQLQQLECYEHFAYGFKLAVRMMAESLGNGAGEAPPCRKEGKTR